ncbi:uncharacterized protein C12orf40-like [Gigantopelta aegis]|uniref:uncharacterized protein C12orf40-like n=1 Tax=Gigantopelta aegis TaxID=1735272 RepID=UPI001B887712|nr:uncharacterized protein C12orf40-like [Gigantopelta aegis]
MNWVGGARNRVKCQNERKAQKEFFERQKLGVNHSKLNPLSTPHLKRNSVSQDLLALQTISRAHSKTKADPAKRPVRKLDLEGFRSTVTGRKFKQVELPTSPQETPSMLDLMEKTFHKSKHSESKSSDTLFHQDNRDSNTKFGFNSSIKFSSLISPGRNTGLLAQTSVSGLSDNPLKFSTIPGERFSSPQKDCIKSHISTGSLELNPFLHENSMMPKNTMTSSFSAHDSTRSNVKPNSNMKTKQGQQSSTHYSKHDTKSKNQLDERLHNLWVSEDFQTTPLIKYNCDQFMNDNFCSYPSYKPVASKILNLTSPFYQSFHEDEIMFKNPVEPQSPHKNTTYFRHHKVELDEQEICKNLRDVSDDFSSNKGDGKNRIFINELTPFTRTSVHKFHIEKPEELPTDSPELDCSNYFNKLNQFGIPVSLNLEKTFTYSDSECVLNKRRKNKRTTEIERIHVKSTNSEDLMKNLGDFKKSESIDNIFQLHKFRHSEKLWNSSEPRVLSEKYYSMSSKILQPPEKLKRCCFTEDVSISLKPSPFCTEQDCKKPLSEGKNEQVKDVLEDENNIPVCTKEEYEIHRKTKNSAIDEVLHELIQLDNQDEDVKNTSLLSSHCDDGASNADCVNIDTARKNTITGIDQIPVGCQEKKLHDEKCIAEVIKTIVHKVIMRENNLDLSTAVIPDHPWTKPRQIKQSLEVITSVFRESKITGQKSDNHCESSDDRSVEMFGLFKDRNLLETGVAVNNRVLHEQLKDYNRENNYCKSDEVDLGTLLTEQPERPWSSSVNMLTQTNEHRLVDASTSPIHRITNTVDVGVQWETPDSSQEIFISADTQPDYNIDSVINVDLMVQSYCMNMELGGEQWMVKDKSLDSQSQPKEQAYTLRPRKK